MVFSVPGRWLKNVKDGTIYGYSDLLAANPAVVEVTEEEAFPEKNMTKKQQKRKAKVNLADQTDQAEAAEAAPTTKPELGNDASKGIK